MVDSSGEASSRCVLAGIPPVSFDVRPGHDARSFPFPGCLAACLEYLGEGLGARTIQWSGAEWQQDVTYLHLTGVTGAAFRLSWKPGWHLDNVALTVVSDDPFAPFDRAFEAIGRTPEYGFREPDRDNEAAFRSQIVHSVRDLGRPVLGLGVVGPPECCIIAGYDEGGDVLVGWSYFQGMPEFSAGLEIEPSGQFHKRGWFADTPALLGIGEKVERPPLGEIYRRALEWALQMVRTPLTWGDRHNGLAAYAAWAQHLLQDEDFPAGEEAMLRDRHMVHNDAVGVVAEGRWYAAHFLRRVVEHEPAMAGELLSAALHYQREHDLMWQVWGLTGGLGNPHAHYLLADPRVRRQIVAVILDARDEDASAAEHIEKALGSA